MPVAKNPKKNQSVAPKFPYKVRYSAIFGSSSKLEEQLKKDFGLSHSPLESLQSDDDWAFVIKMYGFLETAVNHLLITQLANPKLVKVIAKLPMSDRRYGKMAFVRAYSLLPDNACSFVDLLASVRNHAVHDIKNLDLNLTKYVEDLKPTQLRDWRTAMSCWTGGGGDSATRDLSVKAPRHAIFSCCISIMARSLVHQLVVDAKNQKNAAWLDLGEAWIYKKKTREKSKPKQQ